MRKRQKNTPDLAGAIDSKIKVIAGLVCHHPHRQVGRLRLVLGSSAAAGRCRDALLESPRPVSQMFAMKLSRKLFRHKRSPRACALIRSFGITVICLQGSGPTFGNRREGPYLIRDFELDNPDATCAAGSALILLN